MNVNHNGAGLAHRCGKLLTFATTFCFFAVRSAPEIERATFRDDIILQILMMSAVFPG